jgi:thiol:disulfide interchange protein DsbC
MNIKLNKIINMLLLLASSALLAHTAQAQETAATPQSEITTAMFELTGQNIAADSITESPMQGVYQVDLGGRIVFVSKVGEHLLLGDVFDTQRRVSLSEEIKQAKALSIIEDIQESEMIVFEPEEIKRTITVYTDVDCPYCRKLHKEVPTLVENGVKVRYLWFPRSGVNTPSYDKAVSIWCAEDQQTAMDDAKLNNKIVDMSCNPNPVASQYASGQRVGVRGTPTIVVDDGTIIGGYLPAKSLLADLGLISEPIAKAAAQ